MCLLFISVSGGGNLWEANCASFKEACTWFWSKYAIDKYGQLILALLFVSIWEQSQQCRNVLIYWKKASFENRARSFILFNQACKSVMRNQRELSFPPCIIIHSNSRHTVTSVGENKALKREKVEGFVGSRAFTDRCVLFKSQGRGSQTFKTSGHL